MGVPSEREGYLQGHRRIIHADRILHKEILKFYVISSPIHPLILGLPWLRKHDPYISWKEGEIKQWGSACHEQCFSHSIPVSVSTIILTQGNSEVVHLHSQYADLLEAFSKVKATELPPHRSSDCSLNLFPVVHLQGRNISFVTTRGWSHEEVYWGGAGEGLHSTIHLTCLSRHLLRKEEGRQPQTMHWLPGSQWPPHQVPISTSTSPAALEKLRQAKYFTKLDLRSAYNLIRNPWGRWVENSILNLYWALRVTALCRCGLATSVFQSFMNDIFRDMLDRRVLVYVDDILVFSDSFDEHIQHVRAVLKRLMQHQLYVKGGEVRIPPNPGSISGVCHQSRGSSHGW